MFPWLNRVFAALLRPLAGDFRRRLLVSLEDQGVAGFQARYVILGANDKVLASGQCEPASLPSSGHARVALYASGAYFEQLELEARKLTALPFRVRRHVKESLVFNESFRARYFKRRVGTEHYWVDIVAADEVLLRGVSNTLSMHDTPYTRMVLVETAIAGLVNRVTAEPVRVFWMRSGDLLGLLVEKGKVVGRSTDYASSVSDVDDLAARLTRLNEAVSTVAHRAFTGRDIVLQLQLGELLEHGLMEDKHQDLSRSIEQAIGKLFSGATEQDVLRNPELYGLAHVQSCYSLLEDGYQQEAQGSIYGSVVGRLLVACGVVLMVVAALAVSSWQNVEVEYANRNASLTSEYAVLKSELPSPEQLEVLTRLFSESRTALFRADAFLAWISHITPEHGVVKSLEVEGAEGSGAAAAISVTWELAVNYTEAESQVALLLVELGKQSKLSNSKLERKANGGTIFSVEITPSSSAFRG